MHTYVIKYAMDRFPPATISIHAEARLAERFCASKERVLADLNAGLGKKIAVSKVTHIIHRLMWNQEDNCFMVAMQDIVKGTIVTFYTIEMYRSWYPEELTEKRLAKVTNQLVARGLLPAKDRVDTDVPSGKIVVVGYFSDNAAFPSKPNTLGTWRPEIPVSNIEELGDDMSFWNWVAERINHKNQSIDELQMILGRHSNRDERCVIKCTVGDEPKMLLEA